MEEIWKCIEGYDGYYDVSNFGHIRSVDRYITRNDGVVQLRVGKLKKMHYDKDGYLVVKLSKDGIDKSVAVHTIVAKAFVNGYFDGAEVNHIDFNRANNYAMNLEWVSHKDNIRYSINAGHHVCTKNLMGENNPNYGNSILHNRYTENKELSKQKQSRLGSVNGKSRKIEMIDGTVSVSFDCINFCAKHIINNGIVNSESVEYVSTLISRAAINGTDIEGCRFKFI